MNYSNLKELLVKKNISITYLCSKINITPQGFHQMIRDESMKISVLEKIADVLEIDICEFFGKESETIVSHIQNNTNGDNHMTIGEWEKEAKHLRELLAEKEKALQEKERTIQILLSK